MLIMLFIAEICVTTLLLHLLSSRHTTYPSQFMWTILHLVAFRFRFGWFVLLVIQTNSQHNQCEKQTKTWSEEVRKDWQELAAACISVTLALYLFHLLLVTVCTTPWKYFPRAHTHAQTEFKFPIKLEKSLHFTILSWLHVLVAFQSWCY